MQHETRTVTTADGVDLFVELWRPESAPKCVVVICHGGAEHVGRYAHVAERLVGQGALVFGPDHRGQGKSGGPPGHIDNFAVYAADLLKVCDSVSESLHESLRPDRVPWFFFGHSMGGLITLTYLCLYPDELDLRGVVISSPLLGLALRIPFLKRAGGEILFRVAPKLPVPSGMPSDAICRDPDEVRKYDEDPRRHRNYSTGWLKAMEAAVSRVEHQGARIRTPMLLYVGTGDRICAHDRATAFFDRLPDPEAHDQTLRVFEGYYHELHNEPQEEREPVLEMIESWIAERI